MIVSNKFIRAFEPHLLHINIDLVSYLAFSVL